MRSPLVLVILLALSGSFSFFLAGYGLSRRRVSGALEFAGFMAASALYAVGYAVELTQGELPGMLAALRIEYLGIPFVPFFWLLFSRRFTGKPPLGRGPTLLMAAAAAATTLLFWTDPLHRLFYARTWIRTDSPFPLIAFERGPAYWAHNAYSELLLAAGVVNLFLFMGKAPQRRRRQAWVAAVGSVLPWMVLLAYLAGLTPWNLDLTPFGTIATGAAFGFALFRLGILELVPAARELAIDSLEDGFLVLDRKGLVVDANQAARRLLPGLGLREGEALAEGSAGFPRLEELRALAAEGSGRLELASPRPDGGERLLSLQARPVLDTKGARQGSVFVVNDITETAALLARLTELSVTDELTGLFNRRRFLELGEREVEMARRASRPLAVAMLDLDHFKLVNDRFGHAAGDEVLREAAARLSSSLRSGDLLCRYGGEELAVLMPDTGLEGADRAAERFRLALASEPVAWKGEPIAVTTSVGYCAVVPEEGERLADYLGRADQALYRAKDSGRNRSVAWTPA